MDKPDRFRYVCGKLADLIYANWHLSTDNFFSLWLDDLLTNFNFNNGKHYRAITEKERSVLLELGQMYGDAVIEFPYADILGKVYEEVASRGQKQALAQYFTPINVADFMSRMVLLNTVEQISNTEKQVFSVAEPSSGSGIMMLSVLKELKLKNPGLLKKVEITMIDLDINCVKMSCIQILSNLMMHDDDIAGLHIYRGNSLANPADFQPFVSFRNYLPEQRIEKSVSVGDDIFLKWAEGF